MKIYVNYDDLRWEKYEIDFEKIANMAPKNKNAEVSISLVNDKEIKRLNREYRGIDKPTNVLSFELSDDELLGDIFISFDTVAKEAAAQNKKFEHHAAHMVVHGVLHLVGYDHLDDDSADKMESVEIKILKKIGIGNPYEN